MKKGKRREPDNPTAEEKPSHEGPGILYLVGTPIGNLDDISIRALEVLRSVDLVAAEDTRRTRKLLSFFDIHVPIVSFREHNKVYQGTKLIETLKEGRSIAMCSDAGMPLISDPGESFVRLCIENDIRVTVIPGPNAALGALVMSGFSANTFLYLGFIPRKEKKQAQFLEEVADLPHTLIFYESPHRVVKLLKSISLVLGERQVFVVRELTKLHEESYRGKVDDVIEMLDGREIKGEFTLVVEGAPPEENEAAPDYLDIDKIIEETAQLTSQGMPRNKAFKRLAAKYHTSKRAIYQIYLDYGK